MRISEHTTHDINSPLTPEWPSLTARARGAQHMIPVTRCQWLPKHNRHSVAVFELTFADKTSTLLRVSALNQNPAAWVVWMGEEPRTHDLLADTLTCDMLVSEMESGWRVKSSAGTFEIESTTAHLVIRDKQQTIVWQSVQSDLFVGNVPMNFPAFKHADGLGLTFDFANTQQIWGGGEQFGPTNLRGRVFDIMNSDALGVNGHLRYQSTPFFVTDQGHSFAMLQCEPSRIDFGSRRHDLTLFASDGPTLGLYLAIPTAPQKAVAQWRTLMGGVCGVPEWSYGLWLSRCFYKDEAELREVIESNKKHQVGGEIINLDARAWMRAETRTDFVWDTSRWSPYSTFLPWLREQGFHVCLWENPYVSSATESLYAEGVRNHFFAKTRSGDVYPYQWVPTGLAGFPQPPVAGLVDFTNPQACAWWKDQHRAYLRAGVTCFKTDFGEEIPHDAIFADGSTGKQLRNVYSDLYNMCIMDVVREECGDAGILWARSGFAKMSSTPVKWAGDSQTSWTALRATLRAGLSQAVGGAVFWSHDIGGFYGPLPDAELYTRWAQVGLWGSHARMHGTSPREPWFFGEHALHQVRRDIEFRKALRAYFVSGGQECHRTQQSFLRPLWLINPADLACWSIEDQFFAGSNDVLVAPFLTPTGGRNVYLPAGDWHCLNTSEDFSAQRVINLERYSECPVFIRKNSQWIELFKSSFLKVYKK